MTHVQLVRRRKPMPANNLIALAYPEYGRPPLSQDELESIGDREALEDTPRHLSPAEKQICGLSRQCMQFNMQDHRACVGGTRSSCTCWHHEENQIGDGEFTWHNERADGV